MSTPAAAIGARYSRATSSTAGPLVCPRSANSTKRGHAATVSSTSWAAANASSYAWEVLVAWVQMTPIRLLRVTVIARRTAGRMTSTTGTE